MTSINLRRPDISHVADAECVRTHAWIASRNEQHAVFPHPRRAGGCALAALLVVPLLPATADVLLEQPLAAGFAFGGWNSNGPDHLPTSPFVSAQQVADDFVLAADARLGGVSWYGWYHDGAVPAAAAAFVLRVHSDASGVPGAVLGQWGVEVLGLDTGLLTPPGDPILAYDAALPVELALDAATPYWLSILENDPSTDSIWAWAYSAPFAPFGLRFGEGSPWLAATTGRNLAFSLEAGAPDLTTAEPGPLVLVVLGLLGLLPAVRNRSRSG